MSSEAGKTAWASGAAEAERGGAALPSRLRLTRLGYFIAIAEAGGINRAANVVGLASSALSQQLRALEEQLGRRLFARTSRGLVLNEAGQQFYERAKRIVESIDAGRAEMLADGGAPRGHVAIGLPPITAKIIAAPLARHVVETFPGIKLGLEEGYSWDVREWLEAGRIQIGLFYDGPRTDKTFARSIFVENLHLIGRYDAAPFEGEIELPELFRYPVIVPSRPHGNRLEIERVAAAHGATLNIAMEVNSLSSMVKLIAAGFGYALLPPFALSEELRRKTLKATPIKSSPILRHLLLGTSRRRKVSSAAQALIPVIKDMLAAYQPPGRPGGKKQ